VVKVRNAGGNEWSWRTKSVLRFAPLNCTNTAPLRSTSVLFLYLDAGWLRLGPHVYASSQHAAAAAVAVNLCITRYSGPECTACLAEQLDICSPSSLLQLTELLFLAQNIVL